MNDVSTILVESRRGAIIESRHRGAVAVVSTDGNCVAKFGDIEMVTSMRSAAKPFQALPVITEGVKERFNFNAEHLAIITSSHSGERVHIQRVREILDRIGLDESKLRCGIHAKGDWGAEINTADGKLSVLANCCSGKHAGMLARCVFRGADLSTYEQIDHPIQQSIRSLLADFAGVSASEMPVGTENCTAPVFGLSVREIALAYSRLANPIGVSNRLQTACSEIVECMARYPELIGGTKGRLCTDVMRVCKGSLVAKSGAEAVFGISVLPNSTYRKGLGIAIKIEDGNDRALGPVAVATLVQLGLLASEQQTELTAWWHKELKDFKGEVAGYLEPVFSLS